MCCLVSGLTASAAAGMGILTCLHSMRGMYQLASVSVIICSFSDRQSNVKIDVPIAPPPPLSLSPPPLSLSLSFSVSLTLSAFAHSLCWLFLLVGHTKKTRVSVMVKIVTMDNSGTVEEVVGGGGVGGGGKDKNSNGGSSV